MCVGECMCVCVGECVCMCVWVSVCVCVCVCVCVVGECMKVEDSSTRGPASRRQDVFWGTGFRSFSFRAMSSGESAKGLGSEIIISTLLLLSSQ